MRENRDSEESFAEGHGSSHSGAGPKYFLVHANATITGTPFFSAIVYCQTTAEVLAVH